MHAPRRLICVPVIRNGTVVMFEGLLDQRRRSEQLAGTLAFLGGTVEACFQCQPWMQYEHDIGRRENPLTARN